MVIRWRYTFKTINNTEEYTVEIYDAAATTADVIELTGAAEPLTTDESSDTDYYAPIHTQSGYIRIVVTDTKDIEGLLPDKATDRPVIVSDSHGGTVFAGFLTGESYSQPWQCAPYTLELPITGITGAMKGIDFTQENGFVSLVSVFKTMEAYLPPAANFTWVYPKGLPIDACVQNYNFQEYMSKADRADAGTDNTYDVKTLYEVASQFCKYFGISLHEGGSTLYMVHHEADEYVNRNGAAYPVAATAMGAMELCAADNKTGRTQAYRFVKGTFKTNATKIDDYTVASGGDFGEKFEVLRRGAGKINYKSNDEFQTYRDGEPGDVYSGVMTEQAKSWSEIATYIEYKEDKDEDLSTEGKDGVTVYTGASREKRDVFCLHFSTGSHVPHVPVFRARVSHPVTVSEGETAYVHVNFQLGQDYSKSDYSLATRVGVRVRYGNYWLGVKEVKGKSGSNYDHWQFAWQTIECETFLFVNKQSLVLYTPDNAPYTLLAYFDNLDGVYLPVPTDLMGKSEELYFEFTSFFTSPSHDRDEQPWEVNVEISDFEFGLVFPDKTYQLVSFGQNSAHTYIDTLTGSGDDTTESNVYSVRPDNVSSSTYDVDCEMTTRRNVQHGTGLVLTGSSHALITTQYDRLGIERRARLVGVPRDTLKASVRNMFRPIDRVTEGGRTFAPTAQNISWRDSENKLTLVCTGYVGVRREYSAIDECVMTTRSGATCRLLDAVLTIDSALPGNLPATEALAKCTAWHVDSRTLEGATEVLDAINEGDDVTLTIHSRDFAEAGFTEIECAGEITHFNSATFDASSGTLDADITVTGTALKAK